MLYETSSGQLISSSPKTSNQHFVVVYYNDASHQHIAYNQTRTCIVPDHTYLEPDPQPTMAPTSRTLVFGVLLRLSSAVLVAQDSPCSVNCGNVLSSTPSDDIVCSASEYDLSAQGTIFKNCVECEVRSDYTTDDADDAPATSDLQAMLCKL